MKYPSIRFYYIFLFFLFVSFGLKAQDAETKTDSTSVSNESIAIGDISEESEKLGQQVSKLKSALDASSRISEIDSIVEASAPKILSLVDSVFLNREDVTLRDLKVRKVEWTNYKSILSEYQSVIKKRSEEISKIINDVFYDINRWELTKNELANRTESKDMEESFNKAILVLEDIMTMAHTRLDSVFITQKKITELVLVIDEEISNIEFAENQRRKDYFVFDSSPIWEKNEKIMIGDSIAAETISSYSLISEGVNENKTQFLDFFHLNIKTFILQVIFLILFMAFLIIANIKWKKNILSLKNPIEIQAKTILKNPILTTLSVGVLISAFFYSSMVPAYAEFHIMIVLFATVLLLPRVTNKKLSGFLWLLFLVYIINTFEAFIGVKANLVRDLLILDAIILIIALIIGRKIVKANLW